MSPQKSALCRPNCLKENNISRVVKAYTDSFRPNNADNLLANENNLSMFTYDNSSDSDNPFEDIAVSKNINFSRSKSYFGDDNHLFPFTPRFRHKLYSKKENQPINSTPPSFIEGIQKGLSLRKNSPKHLGMNSSNMCQLSANESLVLKSRTPGTDLSRTNQTSSFLTANAASKQSLVSKSDMTFNLDINSSSKLGATSTPTDSFCDVSNTVCRNLNCEISTRPTCLSSPLNSRLCHYTCTPNKIKTPQISSMKRYSLKKKAISAKKRFEDIVKTPMIQKSRLQSVQNHSNATTEANINTKQTNSEQCHSSLNCPSTPLRSLTTADDASINKTHLCTKDVENSLILSGIKQLNTNKNMSNNHQTVNSQNVVSHDEDDDLPCTQPISSILLRGIVAYVEIKSGKEYRCEGTKAELESLGAKIENNFTKKVTHCFFHWGKMSTYRRAIEWNVPLVSTLWIEACKAELHVVPLKGFEPYGLEKYKEELPLYKLKTRTRRPATESKLTRPWKRANLKDKATQAATSICGPYQASIVENDKLVEGLHSVAGSIKKASHQIDKVLTSPLLQKANNQPNDCTENPTQKKSPRNHKKRNKKLIFGGSSEDEQQKITDSNNSVTRVNDNPDNEIRVSYDSDDMLVYAKKQAENARSSAPPRLLTSRKCKKLLSSCSKQPCPNENNNDNTLTIKSSKLADNIHTKSSITTRRRSKQQNLVSQEQSGIIRKPQIDESTANRQKTKKRKLLLPAQTISGFNQDSRESTPDIAHECPYKITPNKKQKTAVSSKTKMPRPLAPLISSDWESDDSLTRAARRESSALFVKKQKKDNPQRSVPTIVCTSLHRSDVEVVTSIVFTLGRFVVEGTVSERTTHVITSSPRRTLNLLKGIARGCWILNIKWIYESLESGKWLHEERFELLEFSPAVRQARVERQAFGPEFNLELFKGVGPIYVCRATVPPAKDLIELIRLCGGTVVSSARVAKVIIGTSVPFSPFGHHPRMVKEKWILDSISQLNQLNLENYISVVLEP